MTRLEEIENTYYLEHTTIRCNWKTVGFKLQSPLKPNLTFLGISTNLLMARHNCIEVFEIHQELWRKGLLTTKNLN